MLQENAKVSMRTVMIITNPMENVLLAILVILVKNYKIIVPNV